MIIFKGHEDTKHAGVVEICSKEHSLYVEEFRDVETKGSSDDGCFGSARLVRTFAHDFFIVCFADVTFNQESDDMACR